MAGKFLKIILSKLDIDLINKIDMNYKRVFIPNNYMHLIVVAYNRKDIFIDNIFKKL